MIRWYALGSLPLDVTKCICQNCKMYFSKLRNDKRYYYYSTGWRDAMICALVITIGCYRVYLSKLENAFVQIAICICPNCQMYLPKLKNVFDQIVKCICPNCHMYLSKLANGSLQITKCICPNCLMYLSKLPNDKRYYKSRWYALGSLLSDVTEWTLGCLPILLVSFQKAAEHKKQHFFKIYWKVR